MKNNFKLKNWISIGMLFSSAVIFSACQQEEVTMKNQSTSNPVELEIGSEDILPSKAAGSASIGVDPDIVKLAKASVWLVRNGAFPEGNIRLRLVRVSDNERLSQSAALDVSSLSTSSTGTKVTWTLNQGEGLDVVAGTKYRIEVIPSYSALLDGVTGENQISWLFSTTDTYLPGTGTTRIRNNTMVFSFGGGADFRLVTQNYDSDGNLYTDQQTTLGISAYPNFLINSTDPVQAPDGFINGQEFVPSN